MTDTMSLVSLAYFLCGSDSFPKQLVPQFQRISTMPVPPGTLFAWHASQGAFERLAPPWETLKIFEKSGTIQDGDRLLFGAKKGPLWMKWEALHSGYIEGRQFIDTQKKGPFKKWVHTHGFLPGGQDGQSVLSDSIEYALPAGALGQLAGGPMTSELLERMFTFRHARTMQDLSRHAQGPSPMRIAMSGASGAIGRELIHFLTTGGHSVQRLVRRKADPARGEIFWQPGAGPRGGQIDQDALEGFDAVIHLAGESISAGSWTQAKKDAIKSSRVDGTRLLARTLANLKKPPKVFIVASGIHYYGDRGNQELTEDSSLGSGFLAEVSRDWEAATEPATDAGIRVVKLRIGLVLASNGGLLPALLPMAHLGLSSIFGSGKQWWSWIGQDDLFGIILHTLQNTRIRGGVNAVTPQPVQMREFAALLAQHVDRAVFGSIPGPVLRLFLGDKAEILTTSTRAVPDALRQSGFRFMYPGLADALAWELAGKPVSC